MWEGGIVATVVGSILGFLASLLPELLAFFKERNNKQAPPTTKDFNGQVVDGDAPAPAPTPAPPAPVDEPLSGEHAETHAEHRFLDFLACSVRPVLTYGFFFLFAYIKLAALWHAYYVEHVETVKLLPILWDEGTEALFATVLSFWFGSRAMMRFRKK